MLTPIFHNREGDYWNINLILSKEENEELDDNKRDENDNLPIPEDDILFDNDDEDDFFKSECF